MLFWTRFLFFLRLFYFSTLYHSVLRFIWQDIIHIYICRVHLSRLLTGKPAHSTRVADNVHGIRLSTRYIFLIQIFLHYFGCMMRRKEQRAQLVKSLTRPTEFTTKGAKTLVLAFSLYLSLSLLALYFNVPGDLDVGIYAHVCIPECKTLSRCVPLRQKS